MIADLKPYPSYKGSGMDWLGDVPKHWAVKRTKSVLSRNESGVWGEDPNNNGVIVLRSTEQTVSGEWNITAPARRRLTSSEYAACRLREGDLVVTKSSGSPRHIGKTSIVTRDVEALECCFSNFMQRLRVKQNTAPRFVWYAFNGELGRRQLDYFSDTTTGLANLNSEIIGRVVLPSPPLSEQAAIVCFLDHADRRIRRYIRAKQKLLALLEEQKQAIIHQAVTGQIDVRTGQPYPAYRPSGVEWLGDVPAHWEVRRIKQCVRTISKGTTPSTEGRQILEFGHIRFLKAENVTSGEIADKPLCYIDEDTNNLLRRSQLQRGDILFVIAGATLGKTAVVRQELLPANTNQAVAFIRPHKRIVSSYLAFWLQSLRVKELTWLNAVQSAQPNLSMTNLGNFLIPFSSLPEQASIVEYLNKATADVDTAIAHARRQIDLLREYRTRLIADVVTGKLDVREAAARLPDGEAEPKQFDKAKALIDAADAER